MLLSDVAYIRPNSRTERPRKTKIGTEVAHVTRTPLSRSKGQGHQAALVGCSSHYMIIWTRPVSTPPRASRCLSIMNFHGARRAGLRSHKACRLWTGSGPQRAGRGHIVSPRAQLVTGWCDIMQFMSVWCKASWSWLDLVWRLPQGTTDLVLTPIPWSRGMAFYSRH